MQVTRDYPISPSHLLDVLADQSFLDARNEKFGGKAPSVVSRDGDSITIVTPRQLPLDQVPAAFKSFVGSGELVQTDTWYEPEVSGSWTTDVGGAPVKVGGTHLITETETGCTYTVDATIKSSIPLVGGAIESNVGGYLKHLITKEQEFAAEWIAANSS